MKKIENELKFPQKQRDHLKGPIGAPFKLVEYGDYECPYCGQAQPIVQAVQDALGDQLCFAFRNFPLANIHPHAEHASEAAEGAGEQGKFWQMHDTLFENQDALEDEDLAEYAEQLGLDPEPLIEKVEQGAYADRVRDDFKTGVRLGVNGTPTFFVNGARYEGALDVASLLAALNEPVRGAQERFV